MIGRLIEKNIAYQADSGDVNFSVREFPGYGKLSGKSLDDLEGDRVIIVGDKKDPLDFVMWKSAKTDEPEDTRWNSPWGEGRPGWHIECSAMSCELLGYHFDIHGGGADLQFPHHENEIAQSEGVHRNFNDEGESSDPQYVNYWMHNGHVRVNNEKMAKSLGNFFIIRDVLKKFDPEVIRFFILRAHYRSPVNYSDATLEEAKQGLERLYNSLSGVAFVQNLEQTLSNEVALQSSTWYVRFKEAMDDDFNTSEAIAVLFELSTEINRSKATHQVDEQLVLQLRYLGAQLGLLQRPVQEFLQGEILGISVKEIEDFIQERILAKKYKDFVMADQIRKDLLVLGVILEDQPGGITVWRKE
jgi:cysteinyl-tRNA synthetase